jgi:fatty-acyl-CoA synthase
MTPATANGEPRTGTVGTMAAAICAMDDRPDRDYTFVNSKGETHRLAFPELGLLCRRLGAGLLEAGLQPGQRIAIVSREPFDSVRCLFAAFAAGIVPVLLYPPNLLGDNSAYFENLEAQADSVRVDAILMDEGSLGLLGRRLSDSRWKDRVMPLGLLRESDPDRFPCPDRRRPQDVALLQFTSGSGSISKAVAVTYANLRANSRAILADGLGIGPGDRAVCWLPLYHDMGLIGHVVAPALEGLSVTLYPTSAFLKRPGMWMDAMSRHKGTITFAPNFAFGLASRCKPAPHLDLSGVRVLGCGAEPIHAGTLRAFLETYRDSGLDPAALFPCYGLAEHTLAAAFQKVGEGLRSESVSARAYRQDGRAIRVGGGSSRESADKDAKADEAENAGEVLEFVSCGRSFPGHAITIQAPGSGQSLPEGAVGEIVLSGPSVAAGYLDRDAETRAAFSGGSLRTGDLGFLLDGRLFVTGRHKDLIIINGRNFDPHHVEHEVELIPEVRAGSAFAFSIPGPATERLVVLYETRVFPSDGIDKSIKARLAASLGITPFAVAAHKAHSLPKTTSGKKRRRMAREVFLRGAMEPARVSGA